jgi:hypothetical protein
VSSWHGMVTPGSVVVIGPSAAERELEMCRDMLRVLERELEHAGKQVRASGLSDWIRRFNLVRAQERAERTERLRLRIAQLEHDIEDELRRRAG